MEVITFRPIPRSAGIPAVAIGSEGNLWLTNGNHIVRFTPSGLPTTFPVPQTNTQRAGGITQGPDGNLWFTENGGAGSAIGRITPSGEVSSFALPEILHDPRQEYEGNYPGLITAGPDGRLWFTNGVGKIGRINPDNGRITEIKLPKPTEAVGIASGPEGNVWYTARGEGPCNGGGLSCSMQIPTQAGIIGRISPKPMTVRILGGQRVHRRWVSVGLACEGGLAIDSCRGRIRLIRGFRLGAARFGLSADERRGVLVRLSGRALALLKRRRLLSVKVVTGTGPPGRVSLRASKWTGSPNR
jgi:hypothetical protein